MIIPQFKLSQDDNFLYIKIDALLANIADTEFHVDEDLFCFYSTPYYLKLNLPGSIVEDGHEKCSYEDGKFSVKLPKKNPGEFFQGLDMITSLLTPKGNKTAKLPLIEVISKEDNPKCTENASQDEEICWYVNRGAFETEKDSKINVLESYGFANQRSLVFEGMMDEFSSVIEIRYPDNCNIKRRKGLKHRNEVDKFNEDHFIADFIDADEKIATICDYVPPWVKLSKENGDQFQNMIELKPDEHYKLTLLPKKEYLIDDPTILTSVYLSLVDILFAYCYDVRINEGETSIESGWNIVKLSAVMSCLVAYVDLKDVILSCFRRCVCYPLYRTWKLNMLVLSDLTILFKAGRLQILKCLLAIKEILQGYDLNHIMNDLYITDYCVWIQTADVQLLDSLATELSKLVIKKHECDLDLLCWEDIAVGELEESDKISIMAGMSQLKLKEKTIRKHHEWEVACDDDSSSSSSSSYFDSDDTTYGENSDELSFSSYGEEEEEEGEEEEEEEEEESNEEEKVAVLEIPPDIQEMWEAQSRDTEMGENKDVCNEIEES